MNKRHLIAVDLDYTILDNLYELNDLAVNVLRRLTQLGHRVMIATARPASMTIRHYHKLGLDTPTALCNGADLVDFTNHGVTLRKKYISSEDLKEVFNIMPLNIVNGLGIERNNNLLIYGDMGEGSPYHNELLKRSDTRYIDIKEIPEVDAGRVFFTMENTTEVEQFITMLDNMKSVNYYYGAITNYKNNIYMSISSIQADKWFSVKETADSYGIPTENIIAFGDEYNDRMMLKNAGYGFVMRNGNNKLKQEIKNITQFSNTNGGVGRELKRVFNL